MCLIGEAIKYGISRRTFLQGTGFLVGATAAAPLLTGCSRAASAQANANADNYNTKLVLLGTAGGPTWWPDSNRASASTALLVGESMYLIDMGHGSAHRMAEAFSKGIYMNTPDGKIEVGYPDFLKNLKALFFTHLHMDHTADYPSILLVGRGASLGKNANVKVIGPGDRAQLETCVLGDGKCAEVVYARDERNGSYTSTPGIRVMTDHLWQAYAQTINDFTRDNGWPNFKSLFDIRDIVLPSLPSFTDPNTTPCPEMDPFNIPPYDDPLGEVSVTATLVNHHQVFPSFAFRFDTKDGSVVFSGDTGKDTNGNLQRLAKLNGKPADILVHEVIDNDWINLMFPTADDKKSPLYIHLINSHTLISEVGAVAESAGVKTLVLSHIVPGNTPVAKLQRVSGFSGTLIVGEDLMRIGVGNGGSLLQ
jgi:ribonuclease BN (tRNA processing enzyme)